MKRDWNRVTELRDWMLHMQGLQVTDLILMRHNIFVCFTAERPADQAAINSPRHSSTVYWITYNPATLHRRLAGITFQPPGPVFSHISLNFFHVESTWGLGMRILVYTSTFKSNVLKHQWEGSNCKNYNQLYGYSPSSC